MSVRRRRAKVLMTSHMKPVLHFAFDKLDLMQVPNPDGGREEAFSECQSVDNPPLLDDSLPEQ